MMKKLIHYEFEMSMIGELNFFLGLQIKQMEDRIFFNQSKYIKEMLKKFGLEDSKPTKTPMSTKIKLTKDDEAESVDNTKYRDLNAHLKGKVFDITALKNELRKLKGKNVINTVVSKSNATFDRGMFKLDIEPISPRLKNNRDTHEVYIEKTIEYVDTLRGFVKCARIQYLSEPLLKSSYVYKTCLGIISLCLLDMP
nr:retrovirus-related Pol polyprotein from transposon TNT 1-94 [Tanacetum cinerariifolium]